MRPLFIVAAIFFLTLPARNAEASKIAVLDLEGEKIDDGDLGTVQDFLVQALVRTRTTDIVISGQEIRALLKMEKERITIDAGNETAINAIASSLRADYVISGNLKKQGGALLLSLSLVDANEGRVAGRESGELTGSGTDLVPQIVSLVRGLFGGNGTLQFINQVPGATMYLSGQKLGVMPVSKVPVNRAGTYELRVLHDDYAPYTKTVNVRPGTVTRVPLNMVSYKEVQANAGNRRNWGIGVLAGGVALVGAGSWQYNEALTLNKRFRNEIRREVPSTQAASQQEKLLNLEDNTRSKYTLAMLLGAAGLSAAGVGAYLLIVNPWEDQLQQISSYQPKLHVAPGAVWLAMNLEGR